MPKTVAPSPIVAGVGAPFFDLPDADGARLTLDGLRGQSVVLFFYPKDDTTGCTREALDFTADAGEFAARGAIVIGISRDPPASHRKFIDKHGLDVRLVSDLDGSVCQAYGVWVEKSMYGKTYMGIERSTFLIDRAGVVDQVWRKVKVAGHVKAVLAALAG